MRVPTLAAVTEAWNHRGRLAAVAAMVVLAGCSGAADLSMREVSVANAQASSSTAPPETTPQGGDAVIDDGLQAPAATLPRMSGDSAVPFDANRLGSTTGPAVAAVVARSCAGGIEASTAFAIDEHHLVTVASALAEDGRDPATGVDPKPWLHLDNGEWVRGEVIGVSTNPNLAVIETEASIDQSLAWGEGRPPSGDWGAVVGYPARSDGGSNLLATKVSGPVGESWVLMSGVKAAAAGRSGPGHMGAPLVDGRGRVTGMVIVTDGQGDTMIVQESALMSEVTQQLIDEPQKVETSCAVEADERLKLAWALLLEPDGTEAEATQLAGRDALAEFGTVGVVDSSMPPFVADGATAAVVLGPFTSHRKAVTARKPVGAILARLDLVADADLMLVPWDTFPVEAPTTAATIPVAPPTTRAPTTTEKKTDERANGDCSGARSTQVIRGAPAGYSYKLRSGPSSGAAVVAMGENGRQVSVVQGSGSNGYSKIALPDGRCVWGLSANLG